MTQLVFGTWQIAGKPSYRDISEEKAGEILEYAYQKGIRYFDTAPIYGNGKSEKCIGKYLSGVRGIRENIHIITKFGFRLDGAGRTDFDFSEKGIQEQLQMSLDYLKTDYIDTYLLHIPTENLDVNEIISTLNTLKSKKLIHAYGLSNTYPPLLQQFIHHSGSQVESVQDFYNIVERKAESLIFPYLPEKCNFMAYSPLYRGLLTNLSVKDMLDRNEDAVNRILRNEDLPILMKQKKIYEEVARIKGVSIEKIAVDFLKSQLKVSHILFGTTSKEHLDIMLDLMG